jgi:hypothetical protein
VAIGIRGNERWQELLTGVNNPTIRNVVRSYLSSKHREEGTRYDGGARRALILSRGVDDPELSDEILEAAASTFGRR